MKPRTPEVNKELLRKATGSLYLITDPNADVLLERAKKKETNR